MSDDDEAAPIVGRRLTPAERRDGRAAAQQWMTPDDMASLAHRYGDIAGDYFHIQSGLDFIRDAHTAADFAKARGAQRVRLCSGDRPDFEIELDGQNTLFEATEADFADRKRGDEYRSELGKKKKLVGVDQDEMYANAAAIPAELVRLSELKAGGGYDPAFGLVIRLNIPTYGAAEKQVEAIMEAATASAGAAFSEVWVMWSGNLYRPWPPGWTRPPEPEPEPPTFDLSDIFGDR